VERQDIGVAQLSSDLDFAEKTFRAEVGRQVAAEHLECDLAMMAQIPGKIDRGHATTAELALERVALGQRRFEAFQGVGQRDLSDWGTSRL
jgi:hypothetical protein